MTATTATTTRKQKKTTKEEPLFQNQVTLEEAAKVLSTKCYEIELNVSWFATSKQLADELKKQIANELEAESRALSLAKRIFDSRHPLVQGANDAKRALTSYVYSKTLPMAEIPTMEAILQGPVDQTAQERLETFLRKAPGRRLVFADTLDELTTQVKIHTANIQTAVCRLEENLEEVKENDRRQLGTGYDEKDYPENLREIVNVRFDVREVGLNIDFEKNCPKAAASLRSITEQRMRDSANLAIGDMAKTLLETVQVVARQLGNKVELLPRSDHPLNHLRGGFVKEMRTHEEDSTIPEGQTALLVQYMPVDDTGKTGARKIEEWFGSFTEEELSQLRLTPSDKRNAVHESTLNSLLGQLEIFQEIGSRLGDLGKPLGEIVQEIHQIFHESGNRADDILKEMKTGGYFRKHAKNSLDNLTGALEDVIRAIPIQPPRKRSIGKLKKKK